MPHHVAHVVREVLEELVPEAEAVLRVGVFGHNSKRNPPTARFVDSESAMFVLPSDIESQPKSGAQSGAYLASPYIRSGFVLVPIQNGPRIAPSPAPNLRPPKLSLTALLARWAHTLPKLRIPVTEHQNEHRRHKVLPTA